MPTPDQWTHAHLSIEHDTCPWGHLQAALSAWTDGLSPSLLLSQSYLELQFLPLPTPLPNLAATFSGRIFNPKLEIRWERSGDRALLWRLSETPSSSAISCESCDRPYYLWGEQDGAAFSEGRIPHPLHYPIQSTAKHDRAFIRVREYRPAKPNPFKSNLEELMDQLNQPRLLAHRFLSLEVGQDA